MADDERFVILIASDDEEMKQYRLHYPGLLSGVRMIHKDNHRALEGHRVFRTFVTDSVNPLTSAAWSVAFRSMVSASHSTFDPPIGADPYPIVLYLDPVKHRVSTILGELHNG